MTDLPQPPGPDRPTAPQTIVEDAPTWQRLGLPIGALIIAATALLVSLASDSPAPVDPSVAEASMRLDDLGSDIKLLAAEVDTLADSLRALETDLRGVEVTLSGLREGMQAQVEVALARANAGDRNRDPAAIARSATLPASATTQPRGTDSGNREPAPDPAIIRYTVKPGDTLDGISRRYGIPLRTLMEANPEIVPRLLQVGAILNIPQADSPTDS